MRNEEERNGTEKQAPRLLFFDIDGTLFDDSRKLPRSVRPALESARRSNCLVFLNTGRTCCNLDSRLDVLPLDGWVTGCGSRAVFRGKTLFALEYGTEDSLRILEAIRRTGIPTVYECDTAMYFDPLGPQTREVRLFRDFADRAGNGRDLAEGDGEFRAVKMFSFSDTEAPVRAMLRDLSAAGFPYDAIRRERDGWEIVPAGCSKATGIERIRQETGTPLSGCYAFGDSNNDLPMLTYVPNSVAMGNAPDAVKRLCAFVADRPERDGIAGALRSLGLIP